MVKNAPLPISSFPTPHLTVDVVLLTIDQGAMKVLLMRRTCEPFADHLVLPGGFVREHQTLDATARWVLAEKARLPDVEAEQLYTFSEPARDPRGWVVSVAHFALVPASRLRAVLTDAGEDADLQLAAISVEPSGEVSLALEGEVIEPGFDHLSIIATAVERIRGKLDWSMAAFALLPPEFTLYDVQRVHEVILGRPVNKAHFRKRMLERPMPDGRRLIATGKFQRGHHRPAELYKLEEHAA
jgi:8-oxo-dGTP diphosphatase